MKTVGFFLLRFTLLFLVLDEFMKLLIVSGSSDKILLKDVQTLTLKIDQFLNRRRSGKGKPQIRCVGGTAGCNPSGFVLQSVQCYNRGSDGYDYQWECKAVITGAYKLRSIAVTCEGYDYPNDPFVVRGSCGFEYTVDKKVVGFSYTSKLDTGDLSVLKIPSAYEMYQNLDEKESTVAKYFSLAFEVAPILLTFLKWFGIAFGQNSNDDSSTSSVIESNFCGTTRVKF